MLGAGADELFVIFITTCLVISTTDRGHGYQPSSRQYLWTRIGLDEIHRPLYLVAAGLDADVLLTVILDSVRLYFSQHVQEEDEKGRGVLTQLPRGIRKTPPCRTLQQPYA